MSSDIFFSTTVILPLNKISLRHTDCVLRDFVEHTNILQKSKNYIPFQNKKSSPNISLMLARALCSLLLNAL